MLSFTSRPLYPRRKSSFYLLETRLKNNASESGFFFRLQVREGDIYSVSSDAREYVSLSLPSPEI
jgi:hypothetical protein